MQVKRQKAALFPVKQPVYLAAPRARVFPPAIAPAPRTAQDEPIVRYDLQGRRLTAPQRGINIVKQGNKTTKVLVK